MKKPSMSAVGVTGRLRFICRPDKRTRYEIGEMKIGVVHGDADSLAGWLFDTSALGESESENKIAAAFGEANVDIFASSHTCLPALRRFTLTHGQGIVANTTAPQECRTFVTYGVAC